VLADCHVLVVDADAAAAGRAECIVRAQGGTATCVPTADLAVEFMGTVRPSVVVSDLLLGVRLLDRLRATALSTVPVIVTGACADDDVLASALPFSAFVAKPVDPHELCAMILGAIAPRGVSPGAESFSRE
jgi:DNA-binding response OmpR family regulator